MAARAGIGQGTVYRYFGSKREILDQVIDLGVEKVMEALQLQLLVGRASEVAELVGGVRSAMDRLYTLIEREPQLVRLLAVEAGAIDPELAHRLLGLEAMAASLVAGELTRGIEEGWIRPDVDADVLSHTVFALVGPWMLRELAGSGNPVNRDRSMSAVLGMLERSLHTRSANP